jgi:hypothetical protein
MAKAMAAAIKYLQYNYNRDGPITQQQLETETLEIIRGLRADIP